MRKQCSLKQINYASAAGVPFHKLKSTFYKIQVQFTFLLTYSEVTMSLMYVPGQVGMLYHRMKCHHKPNTLHISPLLEYIFLSKMKNPCLARALQPWSM